MKNSYVSVVINPTAGNGKAKKLTQSLLQKIKSSSDFELNIAFTKEKNDAVYITRKAIMEGATMIISVGGDGTINEVVNGFFQSKSVKNFRYDQTLIYLWKAMERYWEILLSTFRFYPQL